MNEIILAASILMGASPIEVVKEVLRLEIAYVAMDFSADPFSEEALERLYSEDFADAYNEIMRLMEERNEPLLDGDPITGHQEYCALSGLTADEGVVTQTTATVTVSFGSQWCLEGAPPEVIGEVTTIVFHLSREDDRWVIDDFEHSLYGSFRAVLMELRD